MDAFITKARVVYKSENVSGNLHDLTRYINDFLMKRKDGLEIVHMESDGRNSIVVYKETQAESASE